MGSRQVTGQKALDLPTLAADALGQELGLAAATGVEWCLGRLHDAIGVGGRLAVSYQEDGHRRVLPPDRGFSMELMRSNRIRNGYPIFSGTIDARQSGSKRSMSEAVLSPSAEIGAAQETSVTVPFIGAVDRPRVVIVGAGFGGLECAQRLRSAPAEVVVIDRTNHHLFQPLLYQVATAALSPADIARPIRAILRRQRNAAVVLADVKHIDTERRVLELDGADPMPYDTLVLAIGARHSYFENDDWERHAPGLKTLGDALAIRRRILLSFERAERAALDSPTTVRTGNPDLTFVVVGAGPTGVELAGAIAEIAHQTLRRNFRAIDPTRTRVLLVEAAQEVLPPFPSDLGESARRQLEELRVEVRLGTRVIGVDAEGVDLSSGQDSERETERIACRNVFWAAGNAVSGLLKDLHASYDRQGRVKVLPDLSVPGHPEIFVIGDAAHCKDTNGTALPGVAQVAKQQGRFVAELLAREGFARDTTSKRSFSYRDPGTMATIGRARAVAWLGRFRFGGLVAWLLWSFLHVFFLIGFRNRVSVMLEWIFWYWSGRRGARLLYRSAEEETFIPRARSPKR